MSSTSDAAKVGQAVNRAVGILARHAAAECTQQIRNPQGFLTDAGKRIRADHGDDLEQYIAEGMTADEAAAQIRVDTRTDLDRIIADLGTPRTAVDHDPETAKTQAAWRVNAEANDRHRLEQDRTAADEDDQARNRVRALIAETRDRLKHHVGQPAIEMLAPSKCPTCPVCKQRTAERSPKPIEGYEWWCWTCNTMFGGTGSEYERTRERREAYEQNQAAYARRADEVAAAKAAKEAKNLLTAKAVST